MHLAAAARMRDLAFSLPNMSLRQKYVRGVEGPSPAYGTHRRRASSCNLPVSKRDLLPIERCPRRLRNSDHPRMVPFRTERHAGG